VIAEMQPPRTWTSLLERSLYHAQKLDRFAAASEDRLRVVKSPADLDRLIGDRARGRSVVGGMLSIEGLQDIEGDLANLDRLHAAGFRMAGFAHFFDNQVAGSMHGEAKGGLTPLGKQALRRMEALGMIVDVAHASHAAVADMIAMARRPLVSSHGGVQATCKVNRNLSDEQIRACAATGGVVCVSGVSPFLGVDHPGADDVARHVAYIAQLVGPQHVGLGLDIGFSQAELNDDPPPPAARKASNSPPSARQVRMTPAA